MCKSEWIVYSLDCLMVLVVFYTPNVSIYQTFPIVYLRQLFESPVSDSNNGTHLN